MNKKWEKIKRIDREFDTIFRNRGYIYIIHYSCESFYDNQKDSFKIASIAVRNFSSGQVESFSIHQSAEEHGINLSNNYEMAERKMLDAFYSFVSVNLNAYWIHWNMRDSNYGFKAIEHRYKVLGGKPTIISDNNKFDLARMLIDRYTSKYIGHPRIESLMKKNNISNKGFLNGEAESRAFNEGSFIKLHQSTLKKVDVFEEILSKIDEQELKVDTSFFQIYGVNLYSINHFLYTHPIISILTVVAGLYGVVDLVIKIFI